MEIARKKVDSSALRSVGYLASERLLDVEFANGSIYRYAQVPKDAFENMMKAPSVGKYFMLHIRDRYVSELVS